MLNRKQICEASRTCQTGKNFKGSSTFYSMPVFNNRFAPFNSNPRVEILNGTIQNLSTDRVSAELCSTDTKQQRLSIRRKPTPYRVPYNHYRKSYSCSKNCLENEKIIKNTDLSGCIDDNGILTEICKKTNYAKSRLVNKYGFRNRNNGGNYKNYLQGSGKLYEQNAFGILPENKDLSGVNLYKINTVNGISSDGEGANCKMGYRTPDSLTSVTFQKRAIHTATRKWANPGYNSRTSVNSRNRTQRLKYNAKMGGQINSRFSNYNNCVNGQECSKYVAPGRSTKLFSLIPTNGPPCNSRRVNGVKQTCPTPFPPPPPILSNISIVPSSNRVGHTPGRNGATADLLGLTISFQIAAALNIDDTIEITFSNPNFFHVPPEFGTGGLNLSEKVGSLTSTYLAVGTDPFPAASEMFPSPPAYNSFIETITDPSFNFPNPAFTANALAKTTSLIKIVLKEVVPKESTIYIQIQDDDGKVLEGNPPIPAPPGVPPVITGTLAVSGHPVVTDIPGWTVQP